MTKIKTIEIHPNGTDNDENDNAVYCPFVRLITEDGLTMDIEMNRPLPYDDTLLAAKSEFGQDTEYSNPHTVLFVK